MPPRYPPDRDNINAFSVCRCRECIRHRLRYGTRTFDADGYCPDGFDRDCRDRDGRDIDGFDRAGYDKDGYDKDGYDKDGYDEDGYDANDLNRDGYDRDGYDAAGYNRDGFNSDGYNRQGYDEDGYDRDGFNPDGYDRQGYDEDGFNEDNYDRNGNYRDDDDEDDAVSYEGLHNYSYRPNFKFHGTGPAYYGMELEVTSSNSRSTLNMVQKRVGNLAYLKEDGSVYGFELVTHPMSYAFFTENFPWDLLPALKKAGCSIDGSTNGIHIHVSRQAFSSPSHLFRWMKFIYRNQRDCERIARRQQSRWGSFSESGRKAQKVHADIQRLKKADNIRWTFLADGTTRNRYNAINTQNAATLEVRIFASTLRPERAKQALQLVAGSVEYTRQLRAHDVCASEGWTWRAFSQWLGQNRETYPELAATECPVTPVSLEPATPAATLRERLRDYRSTAEFMQGSALLSEQEAAPVIPAQTLRTGDRLHRDSRGRLRDSYGRFASADSYATDNRPVWGSTTRRYP